MQQRKDMKVKEQNDNKKQVQEAYQMVFQENIRKVAQENSQKPDQIIQESENGEGDFQFSKIELKSSNGTNIQKKNSMNKSQSEEDQQLPQIDELVIQQTIQQSQQQQEIRETNLQSAYVIPDYTVNKDLPFNQILKKQIDKKQQKLKRKKQQQKQRQRQKNQRKKQSKNEQQQLQFFQSKQTNGKNNNNKNKKSKKNVITQDINLDELNKKIQQRKRQLQQQKRDKENLITQYLTKHFLEGKLSLVWLFIINNIEQDLELKIKSLYKHVIQANYIIPLCKNIKQAMPFLKARNSFFKIVVDLDNFAELIQLKNMDMKIFEIYLYNNDQKDGLSRALQCKKKSPKLKRIYKDLTILLQSAQYQINGKNFIQIDDKTIEQVPCRSRLPTYIQLSDTDKSQITKYRMSLYGAIKLQDRHQRKVKLQEFQTLVKAIYKKDTEELQNLKKYLSQIDHITTNQKDQQKNLQVLQFYVQQTFYYKYLNNMLRVCRTPEQFKPVMIPFNQNYHAIKYYYQRMLGQNQNKIKSTTVYRVAPIRQSDLKMLKKGNYVELLGFISTSKDRQYVVNNFYNRTGDYLFEIKIKQRILTKNTKKLDHGFLDLSIFNIAKKQYQNQQEVLFNALNIYKVINVITEQDSEDGIGRIQLEYGSILDLYQKSLNQQNQQPLTQNQTNILKNYQYCIRLLNQIEDHGDVLMKTQQYDKCKDFYLKKLTVQETVKNYNKLAQAQFYCGQEDNAALNAIKSLEKYQKEVQKIKQLDRKTCMNIYKIHQKNAKILLQKQDIINARRAINFQLDLLDDKKDWFQKAKKLKQRGQLSFKQGKIIQSQKDLKQSQKILLQKKSTFITHREQIEKKYFWKYIKTCCCFGNQQILNFQMQEEIKIIQKEEIQIKSMNLKIQELLLGINQSILGVAQFIGDKKAYQQCVLKGKEYFQEIFNKSQHSTIQSLTNDPFQSAKLKVIQAKIQNAINQPQSIENSYQLMQKAIDIIQQVYPMHQKIGQYCSILGNFKKKELKQNFLKPNKQFTETIIRSESSRHDILQEQDHNDQFFQHSKNPIVYPEVTLKNHSATKIVNDSTQVIQQTFNYAVYQQKYQNAKEDLIKALTVTQFNLNSEHSKVLQLRNDLGQLHYDHSRLVQSNQQAQIVLATKTGPKHTQGAKSALLLSRIHLSRGQIKYAFEYVVKSGEILYEALVKRSGDLIYVQILKSSPIYIQIQLFRCKIYNRQMEHDLALQTITSLQDLALKKVKDAQGVGYLADIYEQYGNTLIHKNQVIQFEKYFKKAIKLRSIEMGRDNMPNALSYCTLFKYLLFVQDLEMAQQYLQQSLQIFSRFPKDHPNLWVQQASMSYLEQKKQNSQKQLKQLRQSMNLIQKRYSKNNINYLKLKMRVIDALNRNNQHQQAMKQIQSLQHEIQENIRISSKQGQVQLTQKQDEKLLIKSKLADSIRETKLRLTNLQSTRLSKMNKQVLDKTTQQLLNTKNTNSFMKISQNEQTTQRKNNPQQLGMKNQRSKQMKKQKSLQKSRKKTKKRDKKIKSEVQLGQFKKQDSIQKQQVKEQIVVQQFKAEEDFQYL